MPRVKPQNAKETVRRHVPRLFTRKQKIEKWITLRDLFFTAKELRSFLPHRPH